MSELVEKDGPAEPLLDMDAEFKTWKSNPTPNANAHML